MGVTVSATGTMAADGITLNATQITILAPACGVASTTNQVLVMPIKSRPSSSGWRPVYTKAQVDQVMRTNANSTAAYYNEVSYG